MVPLSSVIVTCILTSGTTAASWDIEYTGKSAVTGTGAFVLATSPTIATPIINSAAHVGGTWVADATWTLPAFTLGGTVTATGQEITSPVLNTAVAKGTWTTSGTWTLPAFTLGGTVTMNGQTISGAVVFNNALSGITTLNASGLVTASSGITFGGSTLSTYVGPTSFTPGLTFGGGATGMTGTFTGRYQRLGGTVTFCAQISLSAKGSSTGTATITGLPVASSTIAAPYSLVYTFIDVNVGGGDYVVQANTSPGNTTIDIFQTGDNVDVVSLTHANFADNTLLRIQGSYFVA
jgi:hypothetical protein